MTRLFEKTDSSVVVIDPPAMDQRMGWHDERIGVPVWLCKTVGGTTMRWSGVSPRFQAHELRALSTYGSIEDTTTIDWPLSFAELEPYYVLAEDKMGVSGSKGISPSAETNNYFVNDGSVIPTSAAANPTLTIVALAIRQADYIAEQMKKRNI